MKLIKKLVFFSLIAMFGLLSNSIAFAAFEQRFMRMGNFTNKPAIVVVQGDINNKIIQRDILAPSGALGDFAIHEPTNMIEIQVDNYITKLFGFANTTPELSFRLNGDNGFETLEVHDGIYRYPITSKCVPLINSKQMINATNPIWPTGDVSVDNKTPLPIVINQKDKMGKTIGTTEIFTIGRQVMRIQPGIYYLEVNVGYLNMVKIFSFKYRDPELTFMTSPKGVIMKDGTYTYFVTAPLAPIIVIP